MTYTVYGIRLKGSIEVRYIGFTRLSLEERLQKHLNGQIFVASYRPLIPWLRANRGSVEAFAIAKFDTEAAARTAEGVVISLCLRLGQRLFNGAQVPHHLRLTKADAA